jgi:cytochrome oxidase Cu insertion factor (SCO1/SenC/PrrC family)
MKVELMKSKLVIITILTILLATCKGSSDSPDGIQGLSAPGFILPNSIGTETSLKDFAGKPVLLFFHMAVG